MVKEHVIKLLQQKAFELGRAPKKSWWQDQRLKPSKGTIQKMFGSWNKAIIAAGLQANVSTDTSEENIIKDILRVTEELGYPPKLVEYMKLGKYTSVQKYGGWNALAKKAGIRTYDRVRKDELIQAILAVAKELGRPPLYIEFTKHRLGYSSTIVYKHFDSYDDLLKEAGIDTPERDGGWKGITKEFLIKKLNELVDQYDRIPSKEEFARFAQVGVTMPEYKFGKYSDMVKEAGYEPNKSRWNGWTRDEIIQALQRFFDEFHRPPDQRDCTVISWMPSNQVIVREFESFRKARELAGIPHPVRVPKRKQITTTDGHIVESKSELKVDEFLYEKRIPHTTQVYVCRDRRWTCDFLVANKIWIEVDGFRGGRQGKLARQFLEKLDYYKSNEYIHLVIFPHIDGWKDDLLKFIQEFM